MVLYVDIDQHVWGQEDFTDENVLALTGTIYDAFNLTTAFDLTGYTLTFRYVSQGRVIYDDDTNIEIVTAGSGTWRFKPDEGSLPIDANGEVVILLEKSGTQISAIGINGSSDLHILTV